MSAVEAQAVLARLCQQAREQLDPQLDASAIEALVVARVAHSSVDSLVVPRTRSKRYFWPAAAIAAAAAFVLVATQWHVPSVKPTVASPRDRSAQELGMDGELLGVGQVLEAHERDLTITHAGTAVWRLRAPGYVRIVETGSRITVALERGRIDAEVVPQQRPEIFAVEVERVRVAVHGTVFSVHRRGDMAEVVVKQGSVRLGSVERRGATQGQLLMAPARMSIDVRPEEEVGQVGASMMQPKPAPHGSAKPAHPAAEATVTTTQGLAERPSSEDIERIWEAVTQVISECFSSQTGDDPGVRVSFGTQISVQLAADGSVAIARFNPPVPQPVYKCAEQRIIQLRTSPTELGTLISRPKVLTR